MNINYLVIGVYATGLPKLCIDSYETDTAQAALDSFKTDYDGPFEGFQVIECPGQTQCVLTEGDA